MRNRTPLETTKNVTDNDLTMLKNIHEKTEGEGWAIFEALGTPQGDEYRIERFDDEGKFANDSDAMKFIIEQAMNGSAIHKDVVLFMISYGNESEIKLMLKSIIGE